MEGLKKISYLTSIPDDWYVITAIPGLSSDVYLGHCASQFRGNRITAGILQIHKINDNGSIRAFGRGNDSNRRGYEKLYCGALRRSHEFYQDVTCKHRFLLTVFYSQKAV